ncbi:GGDEF domain-containing protein [Aureimonas phyllosphaerae]|uniref:diguanylate cyclase n=1 Tax=Aureimonas phyllosphaerae TaxID=1166078 RepID=A0A7W6FUL6_9HYPH|nr:GGDEF domain-containing protein [Aureimonas phyllosphaerae]MBB3936211.1 diguanylate cyclase (GGDEF)-like protein [Aureimonas phyllosphaerae]MBB3960064.1 diguanylate cyclase (GGDEF)-like protein [Aureimonas phyllosphaerae]
MTKPRLQRLMGVGVATALIACVATAALVCAWQLRVYTQREEALAQFGHFSTSIELMGATSSERGQSVLAMTLQGDDERLLGELAATRSRMEILWSELLAVTEEERERSPILQDDVDAFRKILADGRARVDDLLSLPPEKRPPAEVERSIRTIYAAANQARTLRDDLGEILIGLTPDLTPFMTAAMAASDLREYAGRIRSLVAIRLNAGGTPSTAAAAEFASMLALTDLLQQQIEHYATPFIADPVIDRAMTAVTFSYFAGARAYAETVFAAPVVDPAISVESFNRRYSPAVRTTEALRDAILEVARDRLASERDRSLRFAVASLLSAVIGTVVGVTSLVVFDRGVFRPLLQARARMARILAGDLDAAAGRISAPFREMTDLERDIEKLRRQQIELKRLEDEREVMARELRRLATTDPLTGLMNRRAFETEVAGLFAEPAAWGAGLGIVMIDIDHFKSINDRFGHAVGDAILKEFGRFLLRAAPTGSRVARFGGEEFVLALADMARDELYARIEGLRLRLAGTVLLDEPSLSVTASFGVHWVPAGGRLDWDAFHRVADAHLYQAKRNGRNRVAWSA